MEMARPIPDCHTSARSALILDATGFVIHRARELIDRSGMTNPPFLPDYLASFQQVKRIVRTDLGNLDALLIGLEDGYLIRINASHHPFRQNFSCAHEIAHTFLLDHRSIHSAMKARVPLGYVSQRTEEDLCDIGAREILMPELIFRQYASNCGLSVRSIVPLARTFQTSISATAWRLIEVAPESCIAVFWRHMRPPTSGRRKLRVAWSVQSKRARRELRCFVPKQVSVGEASRIAEAYQCDDFKSGYEELKLGNLKGRYYIEAKGFGFGSKRTVVSFIFPDLC